jgi:hypothetical protein
MNKSTGKKAVFSWNDANALIVKDAYLLELNRVTDPTNKADVNMQNDKKFLDDLAVKVGAKSGASVRAKLSNEKVYVKVEATKSGKKAVVKPTKVASVYNIEALFNLPKESLDTLEKANAVALDTLTKAIIALGTDEAITSAYEALVERQELEALAEEEENERLQVEADKSEANEVNELANAS